MENIRFGNPSASDDEVLQAAKRAHAHDSILIFGEATSALDYESGVHVQQSLEAVVRGRTRRLIARKLATP